MKITVALAGLLSVPLITAGASAQEPFEVQILKPIPKHEVNEQLRTERLGTEFTRRPHTVKCWQDGKALFHGSNLVLGSGGIRNVYVWLREDGRHITLAAPQAFCVFEEEK